MSKKSSRFVVAVAWSAALLVLIGGQAARTIGAPAHTDEIYWTGSAYYLDLALRRETRHPDWQLLPARENPSIGKYLIGASLRAGGTRVETPDLLGVFYLIFRPTPGAWGDDPESVAKRQAVVDRVRPETIRARERADFRPVPAGALFAGRALMVAFGLITAVGLANLGRLCGEPGAGGLAALAFAAHPIAVEAYTRIGVDILALGFAVAAVNLLVVLVRRDWEFPRHRRRDVVIWGLGLGSLLALACGSKMNAVVVVVLAQAVGLALIGVRIARRRWRPLAPLAALAIAAAVAAVAFIIANPTLYRDAWGGLWALVDEHRQTARIQAAFAGTLLSDPGARLQALGVLLFRRREGLWLAAAIIAWRTAAALRARSAMIVVAAWWWIALASLAAWLPFAWGRYALPLLPPTVLLLAEALVAAAGSSLTTPHSWRIKWYREGRR